ncbi:hypothetical protein ACFL20_05950 [Spirochaetota bacterium]
MEFDPEIIALISLAIGVNAVWYIAKYILKKNGYLISWNFFEGRRDRNILKDIPNMFDLAKKTENGLLKILYYMMPVIIMIGLPVMLVLFLII